MPSHRPVQCDQNANAQNTPSSREQRYPRARFIHNFPNRRCSVIGISSILAASRSASSVVYRHHFGHRMAFGNLMHTKKNVCPGCVMKLDHTTIRNRTPGPMDISHREQYMSPLLLASGRSARGYSMPILFSMPPYGMIALPTSQPRFLRHWGRCPHAAHRQQSESV